MKKFMPWREYNEMLRRKLCSAVLFLLFLAIPIPFKVMAENNNQKEQAVRNVLSSFVDIWNHNEVRTSFGKLFTSDADFVVVRGTYLKRRDEIVAHHIKIREGLYGDSHLVWNPIRVKFVRPDVAVAEVATEMTFGQDKRHSFATIVLARENSQWLIASMENTLVLEPEAPCPSPK
jgi:uncharacterized protein (TIGR02246 family)